MCCGKGFETSIQNLNNTERSEMSYKPYAWHVSPFRISSERGLNTQLLRLIESFAKKWALGILYVARTRRKRHKRASCAVAENRVKTLIRIRFVGRESLLSLQL